MAAIHGNKGLPKGELEVVDLKTGRWPVKPGKNRQLLIYASAVWKSFTKQMRGRVRGITLTIFQGGTPKSWELPRGYMKEVDEENRKAAEKALEFSASARSGELTPEHEASHRKAGEWCKFCPLLETEAGCSNHGALTEW